MRVQRVRMYWRRRRRFILSAPPFQFARPSADVSDGSWTNQLDSATDLYASIDEVSVNDADYIKSSASPVVVDECKVRLGALNDPNVGTGHIVRYRYGKNTPGGDRIDLTVRLYAADGTTQIASWSHSDISALTTVEQTLSEAEADAIPTGDYATGLVLGFRAVKG